MMRFFKRNKNNKKDKIVSGLTDQAIEFNALGLSKGLLSAIEKAGYTEPTPIQQQAIPLVIDGYDVLAAAQTGTGKQLQRLRYQC